MGNHLNNYERVEQIDLRTHSLLVNEYELKHYGAKYSIWQHNLQQKQIVEIEVPINERKKYIQMYLLRHKHSALVSTLHFRKDEKSGRDCIFYERVFTNLGRISDLPFEDSLQLFFVAFRGFQLLFQHFGFFQIQESMIHVTKNYQGKVWCHKDISALKPVEPKWQGTQSDMVKKVIKIIDQNTEPNDNRFPVAATIYQQSSQTFNEALQKLRDICKRQGLRVPQKLKCLDVILNSGAALVLDEYGEANQTIFRATLEEQKLTNETQKIVKSDQIKQNTLFDSFIDNQIYKSQKRSPSRSKGIVVQSSSENKKMENRKSQSQNLNSSSGFRSTQQSFNFMPKNIQRPQSRERFHRQTSSQIFRPQINNRSVEFHQERRSLQKPKVTFTTNPTSQAIVNRPFYPHSTPNQKTLIIQTPAKSLNISPVSQNFYKPHISYGLEKKAISEFKPKQNCEGPKKINLNHQEQKHSPFADSTNKKLQTIQSCKSIQKSEYSFSTQIKQIRDNFQKTFPSVGDINIPSTPPHTQKPQEQTPILLQAFSKKYSPSIDSDIWDDLQRARGIKNKN